MENIHYKVWTTFYEEFSNKLLIYKDNRLALIEIIKQLFVDIGVKLPTLEKDNKIVDIDPFTVFALFNKSIKLDTRIAIITKFAEKLNIKSEIPHEFDSLPILTPLASTFYRFIDERSNGAIDNLWNVFETAIQYADNSTDENRQSFIESFDTIRNQKGIKWNITMGLFWIRPYFYLNLDGQSRAFLADNQKRLSPIISISPKILKGTVPNGSDYLAMCEECKRIFSLPEYEFSNFPEMSHCAWISKPEADNITKKIKIKKRYWIYTAGQGSSKWDEFYNDGIMAIGWDDLGDFSKYSSQEEIKLEMKNMYDENKSYIMDSLAVWQFTNDMQEGDIVYSKKGLNEVVGRGVVESDYIYEDSRETYKHVRKIKWTHKGKWEHPGQAVRKTLTNITQYTDYVTKLETLFFAEDEVDIDDSINYPTYTKEDFLSQVYMSNENYETLTTLLSRKKNVILQGAPGVGKTYTAKRLAYSIMGEQDSSRVGMIQFHQSYSYEDFIMGYRPDNDGFKLVQGVFYNFCKKAQDDSERDYFFIIDEINRGNLSKIFGELFMLIEHDKRDECNSIRLLYADEQFYIPSNVHIIGMMNTADRSLALLDYALRRRFAFFEMNPAFDSDGFKKYQEDINNPKFNKLIEIIKQLNNTIKEDVSLGAGFRIGHSYFINSEDEAIDEIWLETIINYEIIPLIQEYWFDENSKVEEWTAKLRGAIV